MNQNVQAEALLQLNDASDFLAQFLNVLLIGQVAGAVVSARLTDIGGLWERTNGGGWQCRQTKRLLCFLALRKCRLTLHLALWQRRGAVSNLLVVGTSRFRTGTHCTVGTSISFCRIQRTCSQSYNFADLFIGEREPCGDIDRQVRLCLHGVWNVLQRY